MILAKSITRSILLVSLSELITGWKDQQ
ncbi:uncharacterized protein METZ01_LOCUS225627 [marine metagenome]|uniref:Uncharacterized protein n=1 Tax=marine metagenome TaxID=408172 RepID=A0A382GDS6_9ZZZZ